MNLEKLKDSARKFEQKEDWRRAIEVYLRAIEQIESGAETSPDLSLYNRVGDLHLKTNDTAAAVRSYERAVDLYADQGFFNNAIALCGKILRVNPGRTQTYLKLAQLHARKNVVIEAKRNLIEFLERMNALGQLDPAFTSVKEFADQFSGSQDIRMMLVELLRAASRDDEAREQLEKLAGQLESRGEPPGGRAAEETATGEASLPMAPRPQPLARVGGLVFLDTGVDVPLAPPTPPSAEEPAVPPPEGLMLTEPAPLETVPPSDTIIEPLPDTPEEELPILAGLEQTAALDLDTSGIAAMDGLEPGELELEQREPDALELEPGEPDALELEPGEPDALELEPVEPGALELEPVEPGALELEPVEPGALELEQVGPDELEPERVELDELERVAPDEQELEAVELADIDLTDSPRPRAGLPLLEVGASTDRIAELESRVLDDPDDPELHRELADALLAYGDEARGLEELELGLEGYERLEDWGSASGLADRLVGLAPDNIRHHQKRVELAYRTGERAPLLDAYLSLGDALARAGAREKAMAVYSRVREHDPENARAAVALTALAAPSATETAEPRRAAPLAVYPSAQSSEPAPPEVPVPASRTPQPPEPAGSFVDLGSMVLDEEGPRDTRMRVERREPKDEDEQREFREILEQFKRGIEENLETDDHQAHYDLGVAFKEMGLLDEAIAEFQKALRAPEGRLRTSEALGVCFYEKGQYGIAETVLRRAVETIEGGDEAKIGLLYWLGRAAEALGKDHDAIGSYERALAVDIGFMDLGERIHRLTAGRQE